MGINCIIRDYCYNNFCGLMGICNNMVVVYFCFCDLQWMGIYCEIYVCENNKCFYGYCYVGINVFYLCDCDLGWIGKECDIIDLCKFFICEYGG